MNKLVKEFISFLENYKEKLELLYVLDTSLEKVIYKDNIINKEKVRFDFKLREDAVKNIEAIKSCLAVLNESYEKREKTHETFGYYNYLSGFMLDAREANLPIYPDTMFEVLIIVVKKNIYGDFFETPLLNIDLLLKYKFLAISPKKLVNSEEDIKRILRGEQTSKRWWWFQKNEIRNVALRIAKKDDEFVQYHKVIKEYFLDKQNTYTLEDVELVCDAFKKIGVMDEIVNEVREYLKVRLENRPVKNEDGEIDPRGRAYRKQVGVMRPIEPKKSDSLVEEEWIRSKIDLKTLNPISCMSLDDIVNVFIWLKNDGYNVAQIKEDFLKKYYENFFEKEDLNSRSFFENIKPKLEYLVGKGKLDSAILGDLEQSVYTIESIKDVVIKDELKKELIGTIRFYASDDYGYEVLEAERRMASKNTYGKKRKGDNV